MQGFEDMDSDTNTYGPGEWDGSAPQAESSPYRGEVSGDEVSHMFPLNCVSTSADSLCI